MTNKIIAIVMPTGTKRLRFFYERESKKDRFMTKERSSKACDLDAPMSCLHRAQATPKPESGLQVIYGCKQLGGHRWGVWSKHLPPEYMSCRKEFPKQISGDGVQRSQQ